MINIKEYEGIEKSTWCPGCGDFGILQAVKLALAQTDTKPHEVLMVSGIGCGSKLPHYMWANEFDSLHGRAIPVASGARLANHALKVIAVTGDGDGYGIGGNHLIHTMRRNADIVHIVENNQVYGLTKGQYSPTSDLGYISTTSPEGTIERAINPLTLALAAGATFISRSFSGDIKHLTEMIVRAIGHKGYALIDVLQPCVTFNKVNTYEWYKKRIYDVSKEPGYAPSDRNWAWAKGHEWGERIPIGVIFQETRATYEEQVGVLKEGPLVKQDLNSRVLKDADLIKSEFV